MTGEGNRNGASSRVRSFTESRSFTLRFFWFSQDGCGAEDPPPGADPDAIKPAVAPQHLHRPPGERGIRPLHRHARAGTEPGQLAPGQAAGGQGTPAAPRRESDPPAPVNAYGRSKLASEAVVRDTPGLHWTILRPCAVYGPRDHGFLPTCAMSRMPP